MEASLYDEIAEWYDATVEADGSLATRVAQWALALAGDVSGLQICDLACGQGLLARLLARRGARVTGIDLSVNLLEIARRYEAAEPLSIVYRHDDAQGLRDTPDATFDGVVCHLALMDIPDLAATFRAVQRVLRPAGWFVFSITHPCFQIPASGPVAPNPSEPEAGFYFHEGFWRSDYPHGVRGKVGAYHRTLGTYLNGIAEAGFRLERLIEPRDTDEAQGRLCAEGGVPKFLVVRAGR